MQQRLSNPVLTALVFLAAVGGAAWAGGGRESMQEFCSHVPDGGVPVGNFSLVSEANLDDSGALALRLGYNPPVFGPWLIELGRVTLARADGEPLFDPKAHCVREYPVFDISDGRSACGLRCPLSADDVDVCAMPVLLLSGRSEHKLSLSFACTDGLPEDVWVCLAGAGATASPRPGSRATLSLPPGPWRAVLSVDHPSAWSRARYPSARALAEGALARFDRLYASAEGWAEALPRSGSPMLDRYARWYASAAVVLTRTAGLSAGNAVHGSQLGHEDKLAYDLSAVPLDRLTITLGYREHNPRDSYWTSIPHLLIWPGLERDMIYAFLAAQGADGSFQCCYPTIFRYKCIDKTAYVLHRIYRYAAATGDWSLARACIETGGVERGVDYLIDLSRANGLPEHYDFRADWKDVRGVNERRYAPHSAFVTMAAWKGVALMAGRLGQPDLAAKCESAYARAYDTVHKDVSEGGLWDGRQYVTIWRDGHADEVVQVDQVVGVLFGVIPRQRWPVVLDSIREVCHGPYGPRETYPYRPESVLPEPGDYHNGGVWPFTAGLEALTRVLRGGSEDEREIARQILTIVGLNDLERFGDWGPHERLHGDTGENRGFWMQAWSSMMAAATWALAEPGHPIWRGFQVDGFDD